MSRRLWVFDPPSRCIIGTVGMPGERTFYLQVNDATSQVCVRLEKQQAAVVSARVLEMLAEAGQTIDADSMARFDADPLTMPVEEDFTVGAIGLAWDPQIQRIVLEVHDDQAAEADEIGDDEDDAGDTIRIVLSPEAAAQFCARTQSVVSAGRPPCPLCGLVLEPTGHICPRANGYRRRY